MAPPAVVVSLALLAGRVWAQDTETVWASIAYVMYGERTPLEGQTPASLTPLGAQQLYSQGSVFRARYLLDNMDDTNITSFAPIAYIERNALDNSELDLWSTDDAYVTGSALAFLQGLYPPITQAFATNNGGIAASELANGTFVDFPLDGYQYPSIMALSTLDPDSIWIEGHQSCVAYWQAGESVINSPGTSEIYNKTLAFYEELWSTTFNNSMPESMQDYEYAYQLYDYASYQYNHNATIQKSLDPSVLAYIRSLASEQQFALNGNLSASGTTQDDISRTIAGRTLAAKIVGFFSTFITSSGSSEKLSLMFGSFEPMLSFFALSDLSNGPSSGLFTSIPEYGASMVFELFSQNPDISSFPGTNDLWVRFLYRSGTDDSQPMSEYALFGLGNSQTEMKWTDFVTNMEAFTVPSISEWCETCGSINLFCVALETDGGYGSGTSNSGSSKTISPAVAGVIGAAATVGALVLAALALVFCGGCTIQRRDKRRQSSLGGFKGPEKKASDKDVSVAGNGTRHERVGSWELGQGGVTAGNLATIVQKDDMTVKADHMRDLDDDTISILGREPVRPHESV